MNYQPADGMVGFDIDMKGDSFWAPIAHQTRIILSTGLLFVYVACLVTPTAPIVVCFF